MNTSSLPDQDPPVVLSRRDAAALTRVALGSMLSAPRSAAPLLREVDRATVVPDAELPDDVAAIGSHVCFRDLQTGEVRSIVLGERSTDEGADGPIVSVLSPLGSALIGLRPGHAIRWPATDGDFIRLAVVAVSRASLEEVE